VPRDSVPGIKGGGVEGGGGWGGAPKFNKGRRRPEVQTLTLSPTILAEKVPLLYTFYCKKVFLSHTHL